MPIDASVFLQSLLCSNLSDSTGRKPYIWPALLWVDDATLMTPPFCGITGPPKEEAGIVLKDNMHVGDTTEIPSPLGGPWGGVTFDDNFMTHELILVVALWEHHDFPENVIEAGYTAFQDELHAAVGDNLLALKAGGDQEQQAKDEIKSRVTKKVYAAISNALSWWEKLKIWAGEMTQDAQVGANFINWSNPGASASFFLTVPEVSPDSPPPSNLYAISGVVQMQQQIDQCQAQEAAVAGAQLTVDQLNAEITELDAEWEHASPGMRKYILDQKRKLGQKLDSAQRNLDKAKQDLQACLDRSV